MIPPANIMATTYSNFKTFAKLEKNNVCNKGKLY